MYIFLNIFNVLKISLAQVHDVKCMPSLRSGESDHALSRSTQRTSDFHVPPWPQTPDPIKIKVASQPLVSYPAWNGTSSRSPSHQGSGRARMGNWHDD